MLVVVHDLDELVIVRLGGRLDRVIEESMRYALEKGGREELWDATRADYERRSVGVEANGQPL